MALKQRHVSMLIPLIAPRAQTVILKRGWNVKHQPFAFTEHGAIMAANILNNPTAETERAAPLYLPARAVSHSARINNPRQGGRPSE
jgi:hypothetical protein